MCVAEVLRFRAAFLGTALFSLETSMGALSDVREFQGEYLFSSEGKVMDDSHQAIASPSIAKNYPGSGAYRLRRCQSAQILVRHTRRPWDANPLKLETGLNLCPLSLGTCIRSEVGCTGVPGAINKYMGTILQAERNGFLILCRGM